MSGTVLDLPDAEVQLYPTINLGIDTSSLFADLHRDVAWEQRYVKVYEKEYPQPRLTAWYGDYGYTYSGLRWDAKPWLLVLRDLRDIVSELTDAVYNGVLLNLYTDGKSSIGMHSDDEPEFGPQPTIASLSLGAERVFTFKRKDNRYSDVKLTLTDGSLLVMKGETQRYWKHGIGKTQKPVGERINLTFRNIVNPR